MPNHFLDIFYNISLYLFIGLFNKFLVFPSADASCDIGTASGCFTIAFNPDGGWNKKTAEDQCRKKKARLADLRTEDEFNAVFKHLKEERPTTMVLLAMSYKVIILFPCFLNEIIYYSYSR